MLQPSQVLVREKSALHFVCSRENTGIVLRHTGIVLRHATAREDKCIYRSINLILGNSSVAFVYNFVIFFFLFLEVKQCMVSAGSCREIPSRKSLI